MIEPEHAERLGASVAVEGTSPAKMASVLDRMRALGLRRARIVLHSKQALETLARFGADFDILPSVRADSPDLLATLLDEHRRLFDAIELRPAQAGAEALRDAADAAHGAGKTVAINLDDYAPARVAALAHADVFQSSHAVSIAWPSASAGADTLAALRARNPGLRLWLIDAGAGIPRLKADGQARCLLHALGMDAERVYWCALRDEAAGDAGLLDHAGEPKLLARLLSKGGVAEVSHVLSMTRPMPAIIGSNPVLVTGGAGFIGANLADRLAGDGHQVHVFDALARPGVERNLRWLVRRHPAKISVTLGDLRDEPALEDAAAGAACVFHLAGQVAVTTSMMRPLDDFEVNARGTLALLDALRRRNPDAPLIFASTNKVYGDLADIELVRDGDRYLPVRADIRAHGVSETRPLCFHTPYGCSKGTADQYVLDYAHSYGLRTAVLRMSCIYGERQFGTEDQGWVAHFLLRAIAGEPVTIYGDGRQVRDVLHVGDAVAGYLAAWRDIDAIAGRAYNLGGGPENAISLLQLIEHMEVMLGTRMDVTFSAWRPGDQRYFVADTQAIQRDLRLAPALGWRAGLRRLAEHFGATLKADAQIAEPAL